MTEHDDDYDRWPRLSVRCLDNHYVEARDRAKGMVLCGGLGAMGVGMMWQTDGVEYKTWPGYEAAREVAYTERDDLAELAAAQMKHQP